MISPVLCSSLLSVGHEAPPVLTKITSSFVPMILNFDSAVSIGPNNGTVALYRLGGLSEVGRSRRSSWGEKSTLAFSLLIFLRKKEAMTVVGVW
jgi:hypothetical protein